MLRMYDIMTAKQILFLAHPASLGPGAHIMLGRAAEHGT